MLFKKGQRVKIIGNTRITHYLKIGATVIVVEDQKENHRFVLLEGISVNSGNLTKQSLDPKDIKLISEEKKEEVKFGSKVRILEVQQVTDNQFVGTIGIVEEVKISHLCIGGKDHIHATKWELINEEKDDIFRVGARVRILSCANNGLHDGCTGTIEGGSSNNKRIILDEEFAYKDKRGAACDRQDGIALISETQTEGGGKEDMQEIKVGDTVIPLDSDNADWTKALVTKVTGSDVYAKWEYKTGEIASGETYYRRSELKLISSANKAMTKLTQAQKDHLDADSQELVKAEILTPGLEVNSQAYLLNALLKLNYKALAKQAKEANDAEEAELAKASK